MDYIQKQKEKLISDLKLKGIKSEKVLSAMWKVPREKFIDQSIWEQSYQDVALPIICGQTISQPYTVAFMTEKLDVSSGMKVLEIGTGSGYQSCILAELGANVYSVERIEELYFYSQNMFKELGYNIIQKLGDGTFGWKDFAPYDRIIITAGAPETPLELLKQMKINAKMIIPIGNRTLQIMTLIERKSATEFITTKFSQFRFVPLIGEQGWEN